MQHLSRKAVAQWKDFLIRISADYSPERWSSRSTPQQLPWKSFINTRCTKKGNWKVKLKLDITSERSVIEQASRRMRLIWSSWCSSSFFFSYRRDQEILLDQLAAIARTAVSGAEHKLPKTCSWSDVCSTYGSEELFFHRLRLGRWIFDIIKALLWDSYLHWTEII